MEKINVEENKNNFIELYNQLITREGKEDMLRWICESDFFTAPASTKYHLNQEGGLCLHSLHVFFRLVEICKTELPDVSDETMAIAALLHDLCKCNSYTVSTKNVKSYAPADIAVASRYEIKHDSGGDFVWKAVPCYTFNEEFPMGHGEKSLVLVMEHIKLTEEEKLAIRWHMGFSDASFKGGSGSVGEAFSKSKLAVCLHLADIEATYFDEAER